MERSCGDAKVPAERWDLLDEDGRPTGRTVLRGEALPEETRHLVVHVYLRNPEGRFLVQKRSLRKELHPGAWDVTGGAVMAGERSRDGAVREVEEELGLRLEPGAFSLVARLKRPGTFVDIWMSPMDAPLGALTMQPDEVEDLRFVEAGDLMDFIALPGHRDDEYRAVVEGAILAKPVRG